MKNLLFKIYFIGMGVYLVARFFNLKQWNMQGEFQYYGLGAVLWPFYLPKMILNWSTLTSN